jgi:hypothetical protein
VPVRVLGLLLILLLAGPVVMSKDRHGDDELRFAYADNSAFRASYEVRETPRARIQIASSDVQDQHPASLPLTVAGPDRLLASSPEPSLATVVAYAPPRYDRAPLTWDAVVSASPATVLASVRADEGLHAPQPPQRLAALAEPMHLLTSVPPLEEIAAETKPVVPKARRVKHKRRSATRVRSYRRSRRAAKRPDKVPRWAAKMFDNVWQRHAFAYQ